MLLGDTLRLASYRKAANLTGDIRAHFKVSRSLPNRTTLLSTPYLDLLHRRGVFLDFTGCFCSLLRKTSGKILCLEGVNQLFHRGEIMQRRSSRCPSQYGKMLVASMRNEGRTVSSSNHVCSGRKLVRRSGQNLLL